MMDKEKVEAAAIAIRDAFPHINVGSRGQTAWKDLGDYDKETWLIMARAAFRAVD